MYNNRSHNRRNNRHNYTPKTARYTSSQREQQLRDAQYRQNRRNRRYARNRRAAEEKARKRDAIILITLALLGAVIFGILSYVQDASMTEHFNELERYYQETVQVGDRRVDREDYEAANEEARLEEQALLEEVGLEG